MKHNKSKVLIDALTSYLPSSTICSNLEDELGTGYILHEAIRIGASERILELLTDRFPDFFNQVDEDGHYPIHIACKYGASSQFISRCIDVNPSSAATKGVDGKTPLYLLCEDTWRGAWDTVDSDFNPWGITEPNYEVENNRVDILRLLYESAPSSVACEDKRGVGAVECAIENGLTRSFVLLLQKMTACFNVIATVA